MAKHPLPNVPFVEAKHCGSKHRPSLIVLRVSFTTSDKGAALGIANYHHQAGAPLRTHHYILDEADTYRCIPDNLSAHKNPEGALSVLMCSQPHEDVEMWKETSSTVMMTRTAALVADLMLAHKIPLQYLDDAAVTRWNKHRWRRRGGLFVRVAGTWPYEAFMNDVKSQMSIKTM